MPREFPGRVAAGWLASNGSAPAVLCPVRAARQNQPMPLIEEKTMSDSSPWNQPADSGDDARRALQAVQVALDRRDNGGDAGSATD